MPAPWPIGWGSRITSSTMKAPSVKRWSNSLPTKYLAGRTPVPCIRCNMGPKFTDLFRMARELGADCLATGTLCPAGRDGRRAAAATAPSIRRAISPIFSTAPPKRSLIICAFPLGGMPKAQVRELAEAAGLRNAAKPDSQDICFVPDGNYAKIVTQGAARRRGAGGTSSTPRPARCWASTRVSSTSPSASARGWRSAASPNPLYVIGLDAGLRESAGRPKRMLAVHAARLTENQSHRPAARRTA